MAQLNNLLTPYKGEALQLNFTMTPVTDLTSWTIVFTLRKNATDAVSILSINATIVSAPAGTFRISLTKAQTSLVAGTYQYDIFRTDAGSEACLSIGTFVINQDVLTP